MSKVTAANLASWIAQLDKNATYQYINPRTRGEIRIVRVDLPEGPIIIKRFNPAKGETEASVREVSISTEMLWRVANAIQKEIPINIDRILGASYNTRSVLESLLAYTPQFSYCYPGRIEHIGDTSKIANGHKHLMWTPSNPHRLGVTNKIETEKVISEVPNQDIVYESLVLPAKEAEMDIETQRRHTQIQIALMFIGLQLGYRTWIAQNDKGVEYNGKKIGEYDFVVRSLRDEALLASHAEAIKAALLIDCIWFKNGRLMPAVMEVEHSTGITSGLTRMKNFQDHFPPFPTRYVIVAPDEYRAKFVQEASKQQFTDLQPRFFPYSAVEELYSLCQRRNIRGITEQFLDCYMEPLSAE